MSSMNRRKFIIGGSAGIIGVSSGIIAWHNLKNQNVNLPDEKLRQKLLGKKSLHTKLVKGQTELVLTPKKLVDNLGKEKFFVEFLNLKTFNIFSVTVPVAGHSIIQHPIHQNKFIMFAQRPGNISVEIVLKDKSFTTRTFMATKGRHFYGHGLYTPDGKYFLCTENKYDDHTGKISVRDANTFKSLGDFEPYGIGPHEMVYADNGKTLIVANGGLKTHPKYKTGIEPINTETMASSLNFIDIKSGKLINSVKTDNPYLSIRHLATSYISNDVVGMALQNKDLDKTTENDFDKTLVAAYFKTPDLLVKMPNFDKIHDKLLGHTLSIAIAPKPGWGTMAITCPKSSKVIIWDYLEEFARQSLELNKQKESSNSYKTIYSEKIKKKITHKIFDINDPKGIIFSESLRKYVISSSAGYRLISMKNFEIEKLKDPNYSFEGKLSFGSHMLLARING